MILILDNYDSFTYNLYQFAGSINPDITVLRNDKTTVAEIAALQPSHILISPGPGFPQDAGISVEVIRELGKSIPTLGICLGHQAIGYAFGADIVHAPSPLHGKTSDIHIASGSPIFWGLPPILRVGRYHSLVIDRNTLPEELMITAETEDGIIMGVSHRDYPIFGVQFHPESVLTDRGMEIIKNFLSYRREEV